VQQGLRHRPESFTLEKNINVFMLVVPALACRDFLSIAILLLSIDNQRQEAE
jgi:hypothetical protein